MNKNLDYKHNEQIPKEQSYTCECIYDLHENVFDDDKNFYRDPSKYIPRIKGTKLECGITFLDFNYLPILTSRLVKGKRKYYLFDFIKMWSNNEKI